MDKKAELKQLLITWRQSEIAHAKAVLGAAHPVYLEKLSDEMERALHELRKFVDKEPWPEI